MPFVLSTLKTDDALETEGVWFDIVEGEPEEGRLLIARAGNAKFEAYLRKQVRKNQRLLSRKDERADRLAKDLHLEAMAHTVLLDWEHVVFDASVGFQPYTPELGIKALKIREFRDIVDSYADDAESFKTEAEAETEKNS